MCHGFKDNNKINVRNCESITVTMKSENSFFITNIHYVALKAILVAVRRVGGRENFSNFPNNLWMKCEIAPELDNVLVLL